MSYKIVVMAKNGKGYFNANFSKTVNVILAFFFGILFGFITRLIRGNFLGALLAFFLCPLFWLIDFITLITSNDLTVLA